MLDPQPWEEFQSSGLLFATNKILHLFGWAIVLNVEDDGTVSHAYPARTSYRGFDKETESKGFRKLHQWMRDNMGEISEETGG